MEEPHIPTTTGWPALRQVDRVDWSQLRHAYGVGVVGAEIEGDVRRSLEKLGQDPHTALGRELYSNICHQGTIYPATAYALPFLVALAAGDIPAGLRLELVGLVAQIAVAASHLAPHGSASGAIDEQTAERTLRALNGSIDRLLAIKAPVLRPLIESIRQLLADPTDLTRCAIEDTFDETVRQWLELSESES